MVFLILFFANNTKKSYISRMKQKRYFFLIILILWVAFEGQAQQYSRFKQEAAEALSSLQPENFYIKEKIKVKRLKVPQRGAVVLEMSRAFSYLPFRDELVKQAYDTIRAIMPSNLKGRKLLIKVGNYEIGQLIPYTQDNRRFSTSNATPLVSLENPIYQPTKGLQNRHIALWQSHGYYFEPTLNRWEWQRARLFGTVEDLYTQSYVMPFLIPMLENAGAYVFTPRERDINTHEFIIDNDQEEGYSETGKWVNGGTGFAHTTEYYTDTQNPFTQGSFRQTGTTTQPNQAITAGWQIEIPQARSYAVYVAYQTLPNSTDDACYTIYHQGGKTSFKVNQTMGGGTWIYLGHFDFNPQEGAKVELSNLSQTAGKIVSADAVKIGGGWGNIARRTHNKVITKLLKQKKGFKRSDFTYTTSGYPRFTEAARYWLQWAGFPEKVYSPSQGENDYTDDYKSRGEWVNYLAGGSEVLPDSIGLNIPIDLAFAFHSDAGIRKNDSIVGSLGIFFTRKDRKVYQKDIPRQISRYFADEILTQVTEDIRLTYEPNWTRRGLWDKSYFEARVPEVPTMLLEMLSHQNFNDMRYGLDPRFRFLVSRAVYKSILRFISHQRGEEYVVQPLPVSHLRINWCKYNQAMISWRAVADSLEPTATPEQYILYTRRGDGPFDQGVLINDTACLVMVSPDIVYSFKVTAVNAGGESFPSEILSLGCSSQSKGQVMIVNGFNRVSGPQPFVSDTTLAGFHYDQDFGVPYLQDISYTGEQYEFRRSEPWVDDDNPGWGGSHADYETKVIAGNTFDYPYRHGTSILRAGYSFISCSDEAVTDRLIDLTKYPIVDLILGKEKRVQLGTRTDFTIFSPAMREVLTDYCQDNRNLLVSGAYIASELWNEEYPDLDGQQFAQEVLHYTIANDKPERGNRVIASQSKLRQFENLDIEFHHTLNDSCYAVELPDAIKPSGKRSHMIQHYNHPDIGAGIFYTGKKYNTCILSYPFETIKSEEQRDALMQAILETFQEP